MPRPNWWEPVVPKWRRNAICTLVNHLAYDAALIKLARLLGVVCGAEDYDLPEKGAELGLKKTSSTGGSRWMRSNRRRGATERVERVWTSLTRLNSTVSGSGVRRILLRNALSGN